MPKTYEELKKDKDGFLMECPWCYEPIYPPDMVDVGVGYIPCGPQHCMECGGSQIGPHDKERPLTADEREMGWYGPASVPGSSANTFNGKIIDHQTANILYRAGLKINDHG